MTDDPRLSSPAALRNRGPILDVLRTVLPTAGRVLEIASGSGEHVAWFARHLSALDWQPSDPSPAARASIAAWTRAEGLANVCPPLDLDAHVTPWPLAGVDAIVAINLVHISPWPVTEGLLGEAGRLLPQGGVLVLYGPFIEPGTPLAPSNAAFDADLKWRDPAWGLRRLDDIAAVAATAGLRFDRVVAMPANNLSVIFSRT